MVYTAFQRSELEKEFKIAQNIPLQRKIELAEKLQLSKLQVKVWFQNRRAKDRKIIKKRASSGEERNFNEINGNLSDITNGSYEIRTKLKAGLIPAALSQYEPPFYHSQPPMSYAMHPPTDMSGTAGMDFMTDMCGMDDMGGMGGIESISTGSHNAWNIDMRPSPVQMLPDFV